MIDALLAPLQYEFGARALLAAALVGLVCAVVGSYMVLRGLSFMGDAISHAAFPGVVVAYLVGGSLYLGGAIAAVATALGIGWISRRARLRSDTIIGVLFAGMFGLGVAIYSAIPNYVGDLFGFLFGDVLGIGLGDLIGLAILGGVVLVVIWALWKEFLFATFDPLGAGASGLNVGALDYLFLGLIALTIVVSIQAVGIILVVAMLTTPAATAQLLTARFGRLMAIAIAIGIASGVAGIYVSFWLNLASGASIVLIQTATFLVALALGPRRGLLRRRRVASGARGG
ncbi:MAG TPA: metal ABC transporter permease [Candidatus Limnocylindrales bacterium]